MGKFVWHDLRTSDVARARAFYGELFGWRIWEGQGGGPYLHVSAGDQDIGGILAKEAGEPGPSHWLGYVDARPIEDVVARTAAAGGRVVVPVSEIPRVGKFAVVADPRGGVTSPFQSSDPVPAERQVGAGEFCWDELLTDDPAAAAAFYEKLYGWSRNDMDMGPMGTYTVFKRGEQQAGGMLKMPAEAKHPPFWLPYVKVGVEYRAPSDVPGVGRFAVLADPTGASFGILQP
jgi:predicted enzyme related to lactoylglutathione lyase